MNKILKQNAYLEKIKYIFYTDLSKINILIIAKINNEKECISEFVLSYNNSNYLDNYTTLHSDSSYEIFFNHFWARKGSLRFRIY